jgi:hypothetical protein
MLARGRSTGWAPLAPWKGSPAFGFSLNFLVQDLNRSSLIPGDSGLIRSGQLLQLRRRSTRSGVHGGREPRGVDDQHTLASASSDPNAAAAWCASPSVAAAWWCASPSTVVWSFLTTLDYGGRLLRPCLTVGSISDPKKGMAALHFSCLGHEVRERERKG